MPSLTNPKPLTPAAPNDMSIAECYTRLDDFLANNRLVNSFKIEDDNHGMGMISTLNTEAPKQAINVRLDGSTIRNYMLNNGFKCDANNQYICNRD